MIYLHHPVLLRLARTPLNKASRIQHACPHANTSRWLGNLKNAAACDSNMRFFQWRD